MVRRDIRSDYVGYFKADLYCADGSRLHIREFVFTRSGIIKDLYVYHYQNPEGHLVFRYDNTPHFPDLTTFPHHKHTPGGVILSDEPTLQTIFDEVNRMVL